MTSHWVMSLSSEPVLAGWRQPAVLQVPQFALPMIDRRNYHLFQPLLYQVASAFVAPPDLETHHVLIRDEVPLQFDYLVLATGAGHSYFRHDEWEPHAPVNLREAKLARVVTFRAISYQNSMDRGRQRTGTGR